MTNGVQDKIRKLPDLFRIDIGMINILTFNKLGGEIMKEEALIQKLWEENEEFRHIKEEHLWFHKKVEELDRKPFLTPAERLKRDELKKRKLFLKDRMEEMLAEYRHQLGGME